MSNVEQLAPVDGRIFVYRFVKHLAVILLLFFAVKYSLFDIVDIRTTQMSPMIVPGDVVLIFKAPFSAPFAHVLHPKRWSAVVFIHDVFAGKAGCQRIAGFGGDDIAIDSAVLFINGVLGARAAPDTVLQTILPKDYSPRDFLVPFKVPVQGDEYLLDTLSQRDFCFIASLIHQENLNKHYRVRAELSVDESIVSDYYLSNFPMYRGSLDSVPSRFYYDWFFWDRVSAYLSETFEGKNVRLRVSLFEDGLERISHYTMKQSSAFMMSDRWNGGFDSRYFGPVVMSSVKGQIVCILWSASESGGRFPFVNINRLLKIVR